MPVSCGLEDDMRVQLKVFAKWVEPVATADDDVAAAAPAFSGLCTFVATDASMYVTRDCCALLSSRRRAFVDSTVRIPGIFRKQRMKIKSLT